MNRATCPECGGPLAEGEAEACGGTCEHCEVERAERNNAWHRAWAEAYGPGDDRSDTVGRL